MRSLPLCLCLAAMMAAASARGDILPVPDPGPFTGEAAGLQFAVTEVDVVMPPVNPRYHKRIQVTVLSGCVDGHPNCALAHAQHLIGMEIASVNDGYLRSDKGMVNQLLSAFADPSGRKTVTLELFSRQSENRPLKVSFARQ